MLDDPNEYLPKLNVEDPLKTVFGDYEPYTFQKDLFEKSPKFSFLFAPCGRGKSEASINGIGLYENTTELNTVL